MTKSLSIFHALLFVASTFLPLVFALHASEAGVVDWHKPLIGVPQIHSHSLSPSFHRFSVGSSKKSTQSVILTATSSNILAALEPVNGTLTWRYLFDQADHIISYRAQGDVVVALSGPGGSTFRSFDTLKGDLIAETRLHKPDAGRLFEPVDVGAHIIFVEKNDTTLSPTTDVFVLTNGYVVRRMDAIAGRARWEWAAADKGSSVIYSRMARTPSTVFVVGLTKSFASYTLHVHALSATSGEVLSEAHIPSSIHNGLTDFLVLSDTTDETSIPHIVWLEQGAMKFVPLTDTLDGKVKAVKGDKYKKFLNVGLNERGQFVALKTDGTGMVMKTDKDSRGITLVWEFEESAQSDRYTESIYTGGLDHQGRPYIGRLFWSHVLRLASAHIFAAHGANGSGLIRGYTLPFPTNTHGIISHAALDAANPQENVVIGRFVLTTSTGAVQVWQHDRMQWTREESLAEIGAAELVELPEPKTTASHVPISDGEEGLITRLVRQLSETKGLPHYLVAFAKRFATGSYASVSSSASATTTTSLLTRDAFGFRKVIVTATARNVVFGIDSSSGAILWSRLLGLGWAAEVGGHHVPLKLFVTRTVRDGDSVNPQVVLVTQRVADNGLSDTVVFHIDALTGDDVNSGRSQKGGMLQGTDVVQDPVVDAFLLRGDDKIVVLVDKYLQVHLYPDTTETQATFQQLASKLHFPLFASGRLLGHQILPQVENTGKFTAYFTWTTFLPPGEEVISKFTRPVEPVASFGKVLGDRSTLYKYLNPNLIGLLTLARPQNDDGAPTCGVYLVDGAKGTIVYHAVLPSFNKACDVHAVLSENWLLYTYYDEDTASAVQAKGYRVVSAELYEGSQVNDKTKSSEASAYFNRSAEVTMYEQSFVLPVGVIALATTSTKFGIATKDLILANHRGQIQSFPRRIFDPRRPKRKVTAEEQEEWLIQYDPLIPDDPRRVISHNYRIGNIRRIITSPALLESTSLIFAYGLDLFSSRIAPSSTFDVLSENFNKVQLVLTVAALALGIVVTKPMVRKKKLREHWY